MPKTSTKLVVLGGLYAAQGLPYGFFVQALPAILRDQGLSLEQIGMASALGLPWALKFLWAPLVERTGTLRRWLLTLQVGAILGMVGASFFDPSHGLLAIAAMVWTVNVLAASQDIATDGLAVASLAPEERGFANGLQVAGYRLGMIVGGGALLVSYDTLGWRLTFLAMAAILAAFSAPLVFAPALSPSPTPSSAPQFAWDWLWRPGAMAWLAVLVAFKTGDYLVQGMLRPWLVDSGIDLATLGVLLGGGGFIAGMLGAIAGGLAVRPLGTVRALVLFGALQALTQLGYALLASTGVAMPWLWGAVIAEHFIGGMATATLFTAMMDASRPAHGATDYTLQASVVVFASLGASAASGLIAGQIGYAALFAVGASIACAAPVLAAWPNATAILRSTPAPTASA